MKGKAVRALVRQTAKQTVMDFMKKAPAQNPAAVEVKPAAKLNIPLEAVARAARMARTKAVVDEANPFEAYRPPKGVVPENWRAKRRSQAVMAMDDAAALGGSLSLAQAASAGLASQGWTFMGYAFLSELAQVPEYRQISETIATELTRKWISFQSVGDEESSVSTEKAKKIQVIEDALKRHRIQDKFRKLAEQDGFFGRSHLYIDTGQTEDRDELKTTIGDGRQKISGIKVNPKKPVKAFRVVEPIWTYPKDYNSNDPLREDWYNPSSWFVMAKEVHSSRLLRFVGREVPDLLKPAYAFGGLSLSQMAKPYVDNWLQTRQSVNDIVHSFCVFVLETDLATSTQVDGDQLFRRLELFNKLRDNMGVFAINQGSEKFANVSAPLTSLDQLQAQAQEHMAAVSRIPIIKLLGIQPAGLNASSEGEIRVFEDSTHAYQEAFIRPGLSTVIDFIQLSEFGEIDPSIRFNFVPLRTLNEREQAETMKIKAETHQIYVDLGAVDNMEVRKAVAADEDTPYQGLDVDKMPEQEIEPGNVHERVEEDPEGGGGGGGEGDE